MMCCHLAILTVTLCHIKLWGAKGVIGVYKEKQNLQVICLFLRSWRVDCGFVGMPSGFYICCNKMVRNDKC